MNSIDAVTSIVIALVAMIAAVAAKIVSQYLIRKMQEEVKIATQEKQRISVLFKTVSTQKEIAERQKAELQNKKIKLERQINILKEEIQILEEREAQQKEVRKGMRERELL